MEAQGISTTVALTGVLPFVVLLAAVLSLPVCFLLLRLYRAAVLKGIDARAGARAPDQAAHAGRGPPASPLNIAQLDQHPNASAEFPRRAARGPWRSAAAYACAGLAYTAVMTAGWLLATGDDAVTWTKLAILLWVYFWPGVLAVVLAAAYDRGRRWQLLGTYFGVFAALMAVALARNPGLTLVQLPLLWVLASCSTHTNPDLISDIPQHARTVSPLVGWVEPVA